MKKAIALLIILSFSIPAVAGAANPAHHKRFNLKNVQWSDTAIKNKVFSATVHVTTINGKDFIIPLTVDLNTKTATLELASGKKIILSPSGVEQIQDEGTQQFDDIENSTDFLQSIGADSLETCALNVILYLLLPYPVNLIALYFIIVTCF